MDRVKNSLEAFKSNHVNGDAADIISAKIGPEFKSMEEFHGMRILDPDQMTAAQKAKMQLLRGKIEAPSGCSMQKVILEADIDNYMSQTNPWKTVKGYVTREVDVADIKSTQGFWDELRLDYDPTPHTPTGRKGVIKFKNSGPEIPSAGISSDGYPATGTGFLSNKSGNVRPEFHIVDGADVNLSIGDELWEAVDGSDLNLLGEWDGIKFVKPKVN